MTLRVLGAALRTRMAALLLLVGATPTAAQLVAIESPADSAISHRDRIAVIARGRPGLPLTLKVDGVEVQTLEVRSDLKADFLNVSVASGPVALEVVQHLSTDMALADTVSIHVVGPAARIQLEVRPGALPADSLSQATARIRVVDAWDMPLADGRLVTLQLDRGTILTPDIYPRQSGIQVQVREGWAEVQILSPGRVGEGHLQATADGVRAEAVLDYTLPRENWTAVGMVTGQVGWRTRQAPPAGVQPGAAYGQGAYAEGKAAFFGRGTLGNGALLVASYDSDRKFGDQDRVFRLLTPEKVYPIYGDASSIFYQAPSSSAAYLRLTREHSHLQYGDFATRGSPAELSAYNRSFTGVSARSEGQKTSLSLFGARTGQSIQVDELPGEGVSGHYYLSASREGASVVEGSERIVIQTRDRLHPELVVKEEPRYRFTDYEIDYEGGTLLFKRPVPSHSPDENPVVIVATYETARALDHHWVGGGRMAFGPAKGREVGISAVAEGGADQNLWLTGLDARWQLFQGTAVSAELARTAQEENGWAWKLGGRGRLKTLGYEVYYREAQRGFANPSSPTAQPGVRKLRGRLNWSPRASTALTGEAYQTTNGVTRQERTSASLGATHRWRALTHKLGVETTQAERRGRRTHSTILNAGLEWQATSRLSLGAERDQTFRDEEAAYRPTLNRLDARWELSEKADLVAEHAFRDGSLIDSSFTAMGLQSRLSDDLKAYASYKLDSGASSQRNQAIVGLRHRYRPRSDLALHGAFERVRALRGDRRGDFSAFTLAAEYLPPRPVKASARFEQRTGTTLDKRVATAAADVGVGRVLSLLAKHTYLDEDRAAASGQTALRKHHLLTGLAYRAWANDYLNLLGKYEYKYQYNSLIAPTTTQSAHIGSVETILEPWSQIELFGRYAFKLSRLKSEGKASQALTDLWMTHIRWEWHQSWDVLAEYRLLSQHAARDRRHGAALEAGHILQRNVRLAAGYNFSGYQDDDLAGVSYWAHGPYIKAQIKFSDAGVAAALDGLQSHWRPRRKAR